MTVKEYLNKYKNAVLIGRGGQKKVYKVETETEVFAFKTIEDVDNPRISQEIQIMHDNDISGVPKIVDFGNLNDDFTGEDILFIVEEFIDGQSLREKLKKNGPISTQDAVALAERLLEIECELEKKGIIHRDIKPDNIMISEGQDIFLIDFGIAKICGEPSLTKPGALSGPCTPAYAPLELSRNIKSLQDVRIDLYQIGLTLYESLSGKNPFSDGLRDPSAILLRTMTLTPHTIVIKGDSKGQFMRFISMLMAKNPSQRPMTACDAKVYFDAVKPTIILE